MSIKHACLSDLTIVKSISETTISEIYPHYYPEGAVNFFLTHHSEENILKDIERNRVFLCFDMSGNPIGTVTIKENEICRLFVLPSFQGMGYGKEMLDFAEKTISECFSKIVLSASLPAKKIYIKRGYKEVEFNIIAAGQNDFLCYDVMEKQLKANENSNLQAKI